MLYILLLILYTCMLPITDSKHTVYLSATHVLCIDVLCIEWVASRGVSCISSTPLLDGDTVVLTASVYYWILLSLVLKAVMQSVCLYSTHYMMYEVMSMLFMQELLLFVATMLYYTIVCSTVHVLIAWEYLGLLSYLLIQHWCMRCLAVLASTKSLLYNRVLDVLVLLLIASTWSSHNTSIMSVGQDTRSSVSDVLCIGMVSIKMVVLGMHSWLPDAMEGPTAVSSVIHAATLVVAGVIWMIRCAGTSSYANSIMAWYVVCPIMYSIIACTCVDTKRVIAYTTATNIGVMAVLVLGMPADAMLHLCGHALYKAMLFMLVGIVLHSLGVQDSRVLHATTANSTVGVLMLCIGYYSSGWYYSTTWYSKKVAVDSIAQYHTSACISTLLVVLLVCIMLYTTTTLYTCAMHTTRDVYPTDGQPIIYILCGVSYYTLCSASGTLQSIAIHTSSAWCVLPLSIVACYAGWWWSVQLLAMITMIWWVPVSPSVHVRGIVGWIAWDSTLSRIGTAIRYLPVSSISATNPWCFFYTVSGMSTRSLVVHSSFFFFFFFF
uniref:NADH dehydrogenase subunit 5 n=1 Tax=Rhynchopus euleeides TaxID=630703 RepID=A0A2D2AJY8_9EUGL|nr:NADH dehydrogenase subunit 5 [Rhynchopus euleeides]